MIMYIATTRGRPLYGTLANDPDVCWQAVMRLMRLGRRKLYDRGYRVRQASDAEVRAWVVI